MPRNYKTPPGTRQYGTKSAYTVQMLEAAIEEIKSGRIGQREASRKYNIPRQTLINKLNNKHTKTPGKPVVFSKEEEDCFVDHIIHISKMGIPIGLYDLRLIIKGYLDSINKKVQCFQNNVPGYEWGKSFLNRHKIAIKECFARNISQKRAAVNEAIINNFFDNFEKEIENVPESNIFNMDETGFHDNPASKKLLFPRSLRHPEKVLNQTKTCYTGVFCGSASGELLPPYFIMKGKHKWGDWLLNASPGARMNITDSGWMEQEVMEDWLKICIYHGYGRIT
ncbi:uncharacterized protein LOC120351697 [Nilaparvata lugens]|uniref:uncharacterized protein LOC120351697 n=1 Tax=Nilaparvata lugens TaxID=108931 RepID=UPI00193D255C|nr:uncharacterized protein LOC120351697 [Nilaparvata lugens]